MMMFIPAVQDLAYLAKLHEISWDLAIIRALLSRP